jgi:hypothetical protein
MSYIFFVYILICMLVSTDASSRSSPGRRIRRELIAFRRLVKPHRSFDDLTPSVFSEVMCLLYSTTARKHANWHEVQRYAFEKGWDSKFSLSFAMLEAWIELQREMKCMHHVIAHELEKINNRIRFTYTNSPAGWAGNRAADLTDYALGSTLVDKYMRQGVVSEFQILMWFECAFRGSGSLRKDKDTGLICFSESTWDYYISFMTGAYCV